MKILATIFLVKFVNFTLTVIGCLLNDKLNSYSDQKIVFFFT